MGLCVTFLRVLLSFLHCHQEISRTFNEASVATTGSAVAATVAMAVVMRIIVGIDVSVSCSSTVRRRVIA